MKNIKHWLVMGLMVVSGGAVLSGCHGNVTVTVDPYYHAWYDVYGNYCFTGYAAPGCDFYADGSKIRDYNDPYYGSNNVLYYDVWSYTDVFGYWQTYVGYAWYSDTGILYDEYGNALNNKDQDGESRDVVAEAAEKERETVSVVGSSFAEKYALSEDKGVQIAQTLQDWAKLGKDRRQSGRTARDIADFSQRLYGISVEQADSALTSAMTGDSSKLEAVNVDIAKHWGTNPETSKEILKSFYKKQAAALNIR